MMDPSGYGTDRRRGIALVALGVFVISFDALLVRLADTSGWNVVFWRGLLMFLALGMASLARPGALNPAGGAPLWAFALGALLIGLNTTLFVLSVTLTAVANTVVIFASSPLFAAVFTAIFLRERIPTRTWVAIVTVLTGLLAVMAASLQVGGFAGDATALFAALVFGAAMTLLRRFPSLRVVPLVGLSGLFSALMVLPWAEPFALTADSYGVLALMGLVQMPIAMVLLAVGPRYLPAPEVGLLTLLETLLGPLWVWWLLGERPPLATLAGGGLILATLALHSWAALRRAP